MKPKLYFSKHTNAEIVEIAVAISRTNPDAGDRFIDAVHETCIWLTDYPEVGEVFESSDPQWSNIRLWQVRGFPNHLIAFRFLQDQLEILHVFHGARQYLEAMK